MLRRERMTTALRDTICLDGLVQGVHGELANMHLQHATSARRGNRQPRASVRPTPLRRVIALHRGGADSERRAGVRFPALQAGVHVELRMQHQGDATVGEVGAIAGVQIALCRQAFREALAKVQLSCNSRIGSGRAVGQSGREWPGRAECRGFAKFIQAYPLI